jgi:hypothetical protein
VILDELAEANAQLREWVRIGARQAKAGSLEQMDGLEAAWANIPFFLYNAICFTRPVENEEDLNRRLSEATSYAAPKQLPWVLFLCPDWLQEPLRERTNEILAAHGLAAAIHLDGHRRTATAPAAATEVGVRAHRDHGAANDRC